MHASDIEQYGNRMRGVVALALLLIALAAPAEECVRVYSDRVKEFKNTDGVKEAITAFCRGGAHFKALSGIEYLMLAVPQRWQNDTIPVEEIFYYDAIECDEQRQFLELQDAYVRAFNQQMVKCLETDRRCCSKRSP